MNIAENMTNEQLMEQERNKIFDLVYEVEEAVDDWKHGHIDGFMLAFTLKELGERLSDHTALYTTAERGQIISRRCEKE